MRLHFIVIFLAICMLVGASYADASSEELISFGKNVYISGVTYDPAVFFTDDVGTVTFEVTNGNQDQSVVVDHAGFGDSDIKLTSNTYDSSSTIGPGKSRDYTFSVSAVSEDGIYYPQFSLSFFGANSLWEKEPVKIDNTPIIVLVTNRPDSFQEGEKGTITVQISNPRENTIKNAILYVTGEGVDAMPSETFIGNIESGESISVDISVSSYQPTDAVISVDYNNGDNLHGVSTDTPITFQEPNVEITQEPTLEYNTTPQPDKTKDMTLLVIIVGSAIGLLVVMLYRLLTWNRN